MTRRNYVISLRHILDHATEAHSLSVGRSRNSLETDRLLTLALTHLVEIVGEAANRIPARERRKYRGIVWGRIIGMRNRLIHDYDVVDLDVLWQTVTDDLPPLIAALQEILAEKE